MKELAKVAALAGSTPAHMAAQEHACWFDPPQHGDLCEGCCMGIDMGCDAMRWNCAALAAVSPRIIPIGALPIDAPNTGVIASIRQANHAST